MDTAYERAAFHWQVHQHMQQYQPARYELDGAVGHIARIYGACEWCHKGFQIFCWGDEYCERCCEEIEERYL